MIGPKVEDPLFRKVDCLSLPVRDLEQALAFYCERLGHALIWRTDSAAGLRMPDTDAELVLHTEATRPPAAELLVSAVPEAVARFEAAGGRLAFGPFEIAIGRCAVVADPWGNHLVLLDMSKGALHTDERGNVIV
jgi:predicted enzyme related to lactoylglutathione lyase